MKVVIFAGGLGTRLSEETDTKPKPMVEIGGRPILWHIMKLFSYYGYNDFIICAGYKGYIIKEYFYNYFLHHSSITVNLKDNSIQYHDSNSEPWKVTIVDTGVNSMTGGRLKRIQKYIGEETFLLTYGDGVGNINISELVNQHKKLGKQATLTSVQPFGRFGLLNLDENNFVSSFVEKPKGDGGWINAGFFVLEPSVFDLLKDDNTIWEREPLEMLAKKSQLIAYKHNGFWKPMDTLRDKNDLNEMWISGNADWKVWN
ncbi:MAG: glucose-1-phosphate cytidylyltransferase [Bacteroidia bacterium]